MLQSQINPDISVILLSYNNARYITPCLKALFAQPLKNIEVIAVDNASTDNSVECFLQYPVKLIRNTHNLGGCLGINTGIEQAKGRYILLLDIDTEIEPLALTKLYEFMESRPDIGGVQGKLLLGHSNVINSAGNVINPLGHAWCVGLGENDENQFPSRFISNLSGACFFVRKSVIDHVGMYDPDMFLYCEDSDLALRCLLYGYKLYYLKEATVRHHYTVSVTTKTKYFYLERNRLIVILKCLETSTLLWLLPLFLFQEIGIILYTAVNGMLWDKLRGYAWVLQQLKKTLAKRRIIQKERKIRDRDLLILLERQFGYSAIQNAAVKYILNPVLGKYLSVVVALKQRGF